MLNLGALQSALARPKATFGGEELVPDLWDKAAALMEALITHHAFVDGNKRIGFSTAGLFFELNGVTLTASNEEIVVFTTQVAEGKIKSPAMSKWFKERTRPESE